MIGAAWTLGAIVLVGGAVTPLLLAGRRTRRRALVSARDRARSLMSQLEWTLDRTRRAYDDPGVTRARRCLTLAGSALAGENETVADFQQAADWAEQGLRALEAS